MKKVNLNTLLTLSIIIMLSFHTIKSNRAQIRAKKRQLREERVEHKRSFRFGNPRKQLIAIGDAYIASKALHVAAQLNIADQLNDGPKTAKEIAQKINVDSSALDRMLRLLVFYNIFQYDDNKQYHLTDLSDYLLSDSPDSLRLYLTHEDETRWNAFGNLEYTIKTGSPAFDHMYGTDYFNYLKNNESASENFNATINNLSQREEEIIADMYGFSDFETIIDVGGGRGGLLRQILSRYPAQKGIVYDHETIIKQSKKVHHQKNSSQLILESGSFFDAVPTNGDLYILKQVLHDWDDTKCKKILKNIHDAMNNDSRLLVIEAITDTVENGATANKMDILLMTLFGRKERNELEFNELFNDTGFIIKNIIHTDCVLSIIEVEKK